MNALGELWLAIRGWLDLLLARPGAPERFNLTRAGLVNATGFYFAIVLLIIVVESVLAGFPGWTTVLFSLAVNAIYLGAVWIVTWATARMMRIPALTLAVPLTYAMGLVLVLAWIVGFFAGRETLIFVIVLRLLMFYRAAREMGKLSLGVSTAFAILCIALLAAIPPGLYMLVTSGQGIG